MKKLAVIGTGLMGAHLARRLAGAGFAVRGWNRSPDKLNGLHANGVASATTIEDALGEADAAIVMLSTGPVIDELLFTPGSGGRLAIEAMPGGSALIVMSSIPVETARAQADRAARLGLSYLDAPVSGGEPGARDGTLAILVGGDERAFADAAPLFAPLGQATHLGPAGSGQLAKLANQIIVGGTLVAVAEALTFARRGGADPAAVRRALMGGFGDSKVLRVLGERMVSGDFEPGSPAAYQLKDMCTAAALASGLGLQLDQLDAVIARFESLAECGEIDRDVSIVIREVARRALKGPVS